jgi:hypothetical protein
MGKIPQGRVVRAIGVQDGVRGIDIARRARFAGDNFQVDIFAEEFSVVVSEH